VRKQPKQARAAHTIEIIAEAASQILEREGEAALTTNRIAERAGVSIGTIYQYFPNKEAILVTLAMQEREAIKAQIIEELGRADPATFEDVTRRIIRAFICAFAVRRRAKRILILTLIRAGDTRFNGEMMDQIGMLLISAVRAFSPTACLSMPGVYVMTRAVMGAVRSAVVEDRDIIDDPAFEEELVQFVLSYLRRVTDLR
jgi:AcrR family transcriptional regulator